MKKKKIIVITGALGQDGKILSNFLIKKNYIVYGIIKKLNSPTIKGVIYKKINLSDKNKFKKFLLKVNPFCLVHLGSENPNYFEEKQESFFEKNLRSTNFLIKYFSTYQPKQKLIIIGSSQMFKRNIKKINLKTKFNPYNSYGRFRVSSYKFMMKNKKKYKSNIVMAILFNHDSEFRNKKFLLPRIIKMIKIKKIDQLKEIYLENISGDYSHADDICLGLYKLILYKKNINKIIFSSKKKTYINNIIRLLLKKNKFKDLPIVKKIIGKSLPIGDNSYAKKKLNWQPNKNIILAAREIYKSI